MASTITCFGFLYILFSSFLFFPEHFNYDPLPSSPTESISANPIVSLNFPALLTTRRPLDHKIQLNARKYPRAPASVYTSSLGKTALSRQQAVNSFPKTQQIGRPQMMIKTLHFTFPYHILPAGLPDTCFITPFHQLLPCFPIPSRFSPSSYPPSSQPAY